MALLAPIGAAVAAARPGEEGEYGDADQLWQEDQERYHQESSSDYRSHHEGLLVHQRMHPQEGPAAVPGDRETTEAETKA
eukprot:3067651-Pyramimonas_sp.AAC.1